MVQRRNRNLLNISSSSRVSSGFNRSLNARGRGWSALRAATNESQKTRNKKQNGLAHSRFIVCVTPKQKKHCLIRESCLSGTCAKQPINNISEVTWLCTWFPK